MQGIAKGTGDRKVGRAQRGNTPWLLEKEALSLNL